MIQVYMSNQYCPYCEQLTEYTIHDELNGFTLKCIECGSEGFIEHGK